MKKHDTYTFQTSHPYFMTGSEVCPAEVLAYQHGAASRDAKVAGLRQALHNIYDFVQEQADDEGLWFVDAQSAPEAYLQQELRKLHAVIEREAQLLWIK